jgi:hypothetical protein
MLELMNAVKAEVKNGRLLVDEPTDLPDGTVIYLEPVAGDDEMDAAERAELLQSIDDGLAEVDAGEVHDLKDVIASLGTRR